MNELQANSTLQGGKYTILRVLGQGGFGITYLAKRELFDDFVAIKEFFFKEHCNRSNTNNVTVGTQSNAQMVYRFKEKFLKEAKNTAKLKHRNIVEIYDIFEENETAYYVMEYIDGENLNEQVSRQGSLTEKEAIGYIRQVGEALDFIHGRNVNHLDIKPANIMRRNGDGTVVLIDFGVSKQYDAITAEGTTTTPVGVSHGYSPIEQYSKKGVQTFSPQSDVYSLAATLYKLLTGATPPDATEVLSEGISMEVMRSKGVSDTVQKAIREAMEPNKTTRTQSVKDFCSKLDSAQGKVNSEDTVLAGEDVTIRIPTSKPNTAKVGSFSTTQVSLEKAEKKEGISSLVWALILIWIILSCIILFALPVPGRHSEKEEIVNVVDSSIEVDNNVSKKQIVLYKGHESKRRFEYTGEVDQDGLPNGRGKASYPATRTSGACTFEGLFVHGITRSGEMVFANGSKFIGTFTEEGYFENGTWFETDGYYFQGTFKNGEPCNGTWYTPKGAVDSSLYNGK